MTGVVPSALGVTVKSGWVAAVLLTDVPRPQVADSRTVPVSDPADPKSRQPYHAAFGKARERGPELARLVASVEAFGQRSLVDLIRQYRSTGHDLTGVAIVVGSMSEPGRIRNDHIRIHALEGQLFRQVVEGAARRSSLPYVIWRVRDLYETARVLLRKREDTIRREIANLGRGRSGPWRAEQKAAALGAWLVLERPGNHSGSPGL